MVIGKSGSGKSFFLKNLILNEWANGTRITVLDPESEYVGLTHNLKGNVIDVGNAKEGKINPFHIYKILTYVGLTHNLKGNVIDVGNAKEGKINPFHIYKILTEDGIPADPVITFNTHLKMLESFFKIVLQGASSDVIELINNLVVETYERKGVTETTDCTNLTPNDFPLFTDLLYTLQSKNKDGIDNLTLRDMKTSELYLQKFVTGTCPYLLRGIAALVG